MSDRYDVLGIGNAIVDVLAHSDEAFLTTHDIPKGGMILIDTEKAAAIYGGMEPVAQVSGGSAANSIACLASLQGLGAFVGKLGEDELGDVFRSSLRKNNVHFESATTNEAPTGRCLINVTPDAERSMATFIGAAAMITEEDMTPELIRAAKVTYFEGYLFGYDNAVDAFTHACGIAHKAGNKTALTLSDAGLVSALKGRILPVIKDYVDIVFANEAEALALFDVTDLDEAVSALRDITPFGAITRSEKGSIVFGPDTDPVAVPGYKPAQLIDTTGAGDAYAGGWLYGFGRNLDLEDCARIGSLCATEVISHIGPRPEVSLAELAKAEGLIK